MIAHEIHKGKLLQNNSESNMQNFYIFLGMGIYFAWTLPGSWNLGDVIDIIWTGFRTPFVMVQGMVGIAHLTFCKS